MATVLVLGRLCDASSELHLAERFYASSALADLLSVPADKVNEDRLYRALDALLPHKLALEKHLKEKLGELFQLEYDLLLYDVTSTYFEGQAEKNPQAQRGYSRDHRGDCKQVNIALVVSRCGMPLGYELFAGNRHDSTTLKEMVEHIEGLYGRASRIWVMDRGMAGEDNVEFLREGGRRYIVGTAKNSLRKFERELLSEDWRLVHEGLEVRIAPAPGGSEVFILCRSADRRAKEQAMHERFEKRIEEGLAKIRTSCQKKKQHPVTIATRVGRLLGKNTRAAALFDVKVEADAGGFARLRWSKVEAWREWARLSEGCYVLRSNVTDWSPEDLWRAYIQLTEAEAAFHIHKSDLAIRPVWHRRSTGYRRTSWFASWLTCSGKPWPPVAGRRGWATNRGKFSKPSPRSRWWTWCYPPDWGRRSASAASVSPPSTSRSCSSGSVETAQRAGTSGDVVETRPCRRRNQGLYPSNC